MTWRRSASLVAVLGAIFLLVWQAPPLHAFQGLSAYLPLHTFMETFAVVVAALVFGIGWNAHSSERPRNIVLLACAFLAVALLDFGHLMSYHGMPDFVTPSGPEKAIDFWLGARFMAAVALLAVALLPWKPFESQFPRYVLLAGSLAYAALVYCLVLYVPESLPHTFIPGLGLTPFKIGFEYALIAIHLLTALIFYLQSRGDRPYDVNGLFTAVAVMALSEMCFTLYSQVTDVFNLLGHIYKVIAYGLLYRAVFVDSVHEPYVRLHQSERQIWQEKERVQVTLESIGDAVITTDGQGRVEYLNPVAVEMTGWTNKEAQGMPLPTVFRIVNETTRETVENPLDRCLREGIVIGLANHTVLIRRDGREYGIEDSAAPIRDREGEITGAVMVFHDVTLRRRARDIVQENEVRLRTLIDAMPDLVVFKDGEGRWLEANEYCRQLLELNDHEFRGRTDVELAAEETFRHSVLSGWAAADLSAWKAGGALRSEETVPTREGGARVFDMIRVPLFHQDGRRRGVVTVGRDVTEAKGMDARARLLAAVLESTPDFVGIVDAAGHLVYANEAMKTALDVGATAEDALPGLMARLHPEWARRIVEEEGIPRALQRGVWGGETAILASDGEEIPVSQVITSHRDDHGQPGFLATIMRDIRERKEFERQLSHMTHFDMLTGLPNRLLFHDRLSLAVAHAHRSREIAGVMFVDLDQFKNVNDTMGHGAGDQLLKEAGQRLTACIREGDTVARFGADEFSIILLSLAQPQDAALVAQKIMQAMVPPFVIQGREIFLTASIGIAIYPDDDDTVEGLVKAADAAMHQSKSDGRNTYHFFTPALNDKAMERFTMESGLRHALEREEFELHYQPRVNLATGAISGMEALVRWRHPERGMISPAQFIPIAEATGLIVPLGDWVLRTACRQSKVWQDAGYAPFNVAVNLSVRQFKEGAILGAVAQALAESGLEASRLELELTESLLMEGEDMVASLNGLKRMGVQLALDDFGTGFSSLSYLKRFPIDQLKVDQSFVRDITTDSSDAALVVAIIAMAHGLKLSVVAEGVETAEQLQFLRTHACEEMQGYYFSKPLPAHEFEALLKSGRTLA